MNGLAGLGQALADLLQNGGIGGAGGAGRHNGDAVGTCGDGADGLPVSHGLDGFLGGAVVGDGEGVGGFASRSWVILVVTMSGPPTASGKSFAPEFSSGVTNDNNMSIRTVLSPRIRPASLRYCLLAVAVSASLAALVVAGVGSAVFALVDAVVMDMEWSPSMS